jgi:adenylate cyclase
MSETRKLATIVALDVAGYSARTEADESRTAAEIGALRELINGIAREHNGRVFNTAGDGFMLEFGSSVAAVEAALELAAKCEPRVRVGVHVGDGVVQANGDLLGHGVNVAARLMARSEPGSALVSADVRRMIRGPIAERLVSRGPMQLDKMAETIEAFAFAAVASHRPMPVPGAEPVLAVLPFDNLSNDSEMQFFSDGVSEEILQVLTSGSGMRVIGRTSAFQFRGARKGDAARTLKATHILDGAVRKAGTRLRVNAQLTEGDGGAALWSERYDRDLTDVFAMQDDIAAKVASALRAVLLSAPRDRPIEPRAYELYLKALQERAISQTDETFRRVESLLDQVVALAPDFADAWGWLGQIRTMLLPRDRDMLGEPRHEAAFSAARRALALSPNCAMGYVALANLKPAFSEYAEKIDTMRRAVEMAPNNGLPPAHLAMMLVSAGRCKEALAFTQKAVALDPMEPRNVAAVATSLQNLGREQEGFAQLDEAARLQPPNIWNPFGRFNLLFSAGRYAEAAEVLNVSILGSSAEYGQALRSLIGLPSLPQEQRTALFQSVLEPAQDRPLGLRECTLAAHLGCADLAFDHLFAALDTGRPIVLSLTTLPITRAATLYLVFGSLQGAVFRADMRFPSFCARVGLVDYWRTSGHWPDCATEVPYDFKAACEKAAREVSKA